MRGGGGGRGGEGMGELEYTIEKKCRAEVIVRSPDDTRRCEFCRAHL